MSFLILKNIGIDAGGRCIHQQLNMTISRGESWGIIGGSGSGKTLLLKTILGLHPLRTGSIIYDGINLTDADPKDYQKIYQQWGVVFQTGALFSSMTVLENVAWPLREAEPDIPWSVAESQAKARLHLVGFPEKSFVCLPSELSGGMTKRASLARALIRDPNVLFMDEPTAGLDPQSAQHFDVLIEQLKTLLKLTVIMVTHDLESLATLCDHVGFVHSQGLTVGSLEDLKSSQESVIIDYFQSYARRGLGHQLSCN